MASKSEDQRIDVDIATEIDQNGFALWKGAISEWQVQRLLEDIDTHRAQEERKGAGLRTLLQSCPEVARFADNDGQELVRQATAQTVFAVRAILFDKNEHSNWFVRWHQDRSIPVEERIEVQGFGGWSEKDGVTHVRPPTEYLESMLSIRIHLDPCGIANGAIKFIAGSHKLGPIDSADIPKHRSERPEIIVPAEVGDVILMRPLTLHASSKASSPNRRRVLHIEYAAVDLPGGLKWARA
jgi:hypothetical protein